MRQLKFPILIIFSLFFSICTSLCRAEPIAAGIQQLFKTTPKINIKAASVGIIIQSMRTGKILYKYNADHLLSPASVQKIFTAAAALTYLKPSFQFKTEILTNGKISKHTLDGNLIFKFSGDPEFKEKDLDAMIRKLQHHDIRRIKGYVFIDNSDFKATPPYPPGWIWDDLSYSYAAPMNAIIINQNKFTLHISPAEKIGKRPAIKVDLPPGVITINNHMTTTARYQKNCPVAIYSNNHNYYDFEGCLVKAWGTQHRVLALRNMEFYAKALIKQLLQKHNIKYEGRIRFTKAKANDSVLVTHESPPLAKIIRHALKDSDNLVTNAILMKLGEAYFGKPASWKNSLRALKKILAEPTGINFKTNLINDGAGLSRYNLVTPLQISKLLNYAFHNSEIKKPFISALPIAGKDGTLEYRMRNAKVGNRVKAKTGSMTGISALAGFIYNKNYGVMSFVILINGFVGKRKPYIKLENHICEFLVNVKGKEK